MAEIDATPSAVSPPAKPRLPAFLEKVLSSEAHPAIGWQPPDQDWVRRHAGELRDALADLHRASTPADEGWIRERLAVLATYKGSRPGVPAEWRIRAEEYLRLLGHYPADIWHDAIDEWSLGNRFFPDLSELNELMHPMLEQRRRYLERLEAMLRPKVEHTPRACQVWRDHQQQLEDELPVQAWSWLSQVTPHQDDGATLILAVPSRFIGQTIREKFGAALERVLEREVKFILTSYAGPAAYARKQREDAA